jgi:hypothetical protein
MTHANPAAPIRRAALILASAALLPACATTTPVRAQDPLAQPGEVHFGDITQLTFGGQNA